MYFVNSEKSRNNPNVLQREKPRLGLKTIHPTNFCGAQVLGDMRGGGGSRNDLVSAHVELLVQ